MKKLIFALLLALPLAGWLTACGGSDEGDTPTPPTPVKLAVESVTPSNEIPAEGAQLTITLTAPAIPQVSCDAAWITGGKMERSGDKCTYTCTVEKNNTFEVRLANFTFKTAGQQAVWVLTQAASVPEPPVAGINPIGLGWNLGNQMDAHNNGVAGETAWGNPVATQALFDKLKADGFTTVRIPVTWLGKVGAAPDYKIDQAWLDRVAEIVGYCENAGLKAIVNIHHDGAESKYWLDVKTAATDPDTNTRIKEQLAAMWTQIANRFADKGDFLIFEPFNEVHDGGWGWGANRNDGGKQYACVNEWNQVFVDAVRATGGRNFTRWLAVVGYCSNPDLTLEKLKIPTDPANRLMLAVHFYDPTTFTLEDKYQEWGHTGHAGKKESWGDEEDVLKTFGKLRDFAASGMPVYIGEGGCSHRSYDIGERFRFYYLEYVAKAARDYGLGYVIWDNGATGAGRESHGYYRHSDGSYINNSADAIEFLTRGYLTDDPAYTLESVYKSAPRYNVTIQ